jgi:hypothetical protein
MNPIDTVLDLIMDWEKCHRTIAMLTLLRLTGYSYLDVLCIAYKYEKDARLDTILNNLTGPHGYAIYRTMKAKVEHGQG